MMESDEVVEVSQGLASTPLPKIDEPSSPLSLPPEEDLYSPPKRVLRSRNKPADTATSNAKGEALSTQAEKKPASRTPRKRKWTAEKLLTDPKSPLASADLRSVVSNPVAWQVLSQEEKNEVLDLFPEEQHILDSGSEDARLNFSTLLNDDNFRKECATYTENISQGRHDPDWLASAWAAHERRKIGDFDGFLVEQFETDWAVKLPEEAKPRRMIEGSEEPANKAAKANGASTLEKVGLEDEETTNGDVAEDDKMQGVRNHPMEELAVASLTEQNSTRDNLDRSDHLECEASAMDTDELQTVPAGGRSHGQSIIVAIPAQDSPVKANGTGPDESEDELAQ